MRLRSLRKSKPATIFKTRVLARLGFHFTVGAAVKIYPDDTFIVSYPRSGNTWLRFLIGGLVFQSEISFENMELFVPDIHRCTHPHLESLPRPRYLKSHFPYDPRYPRVIYLVRDPRDVAVSYYQFLVKFRRTEKTFDQFIMDFVTNQTAYGGWGNHLSSWRQHRDQVPHGILFVRYEDLLADTYKALCTICVFLGIEPEKERLLEVIENNQFSKMQEKERQAGEISLFKDSDRTIQFIRQGTTGQWRTHLTQSQASMFSDAFGTLALTLGYRLGASN